MLQKSIVTGAAWLEIAVGVTVVAAPNFLSVLLFATRLEGAGMPIARLAGIALLALGTSCLPSVQTAPRRKSVLGLLVYNSGAAILFAWVGVATALHGFLLWPAAILHAGIAAALLPQFLTRSSLAA
jgi:hypothetical protein